MHESFRRLSVKWSSYFSDLMQPVKAQWTNRAIYNGGPIQSRIWSIERCHFQWPWKAPTHNLKVTPFFDAEYLRNGTRYRHSFTNRDLHTPYSTVSFRMTLIDLERFSKIFNDTKRRTVSLRQLSFLSSERSGQTTIRRNRDLLQNKSWIVELDKTRGCFTDNVDRHLVGSFAVFHDWSSFTQSTAWPRT